MLSVLLEPEVSPFLCTHLCVNGRLQSLSICQLSKERATVFVPSPDDGDSLGSGRGGSDRGQEELALGIALAHSSVSRLVLDTCWGQEGDDWPEMFHVEGPVYLAAGVQRLLQQGQLQELGSCVCLFLQLC